MNWRTKLTRSIWRLQANRIWGDAWFTGVDRRWKDDDGYRKRPRARLVVGRGDAARSTRTMSGRCMAWPNACRNAANATNFRWCKRSSRLRSRWPTCRLPRHACVEPSSRLRAAAALERHGGPGRQNPCAADGLRCASRVGKLSRLFRFQIGLPLALAGERIHSRAVREGLLARGDIFVPP